MPTFIKAGFWIKSKKQLEGYLNLDSLIRQQEGSTVKEFSVRFGSTNQSETNIPVISTVVNDFGENNITINRSGGQFYINSLNNSFTLNKVIVEIVDDFVTRPFVIFRPIMEEASSDYLSLQGYDISTLSVINPSMQFDQLRLTVKVYQ